ncbi:MAG: DUF433 domain-containing protein [Chloroflexota bacterium]
MREITIQVNEQEQADEIVRLISNLEFATSIEVEPIWKPTKKVITSAHIRETSIGPMISDSRVSVYDVMEIYDEGDSVAEICDTYNLSPIQVEVAIQYIHKHRVRLEPELKEILVKKAEREAYHRAMVAERERQFPPPVMTPKRMQLKALIEKNRRELGII